MTSIAAQAPVSGRHPERFSPSRYFPFLMLLAAAVVPACGGADQTSPTPAVASITISVPNSFIIPGSSRQLVATLKAANGLALTDRTVTWTSSLTGVATITSSGLFAAVAPGTTTVSASSGGQTGTVSVTVSPIPVASVTLDPPVVGFMNTTFTFRIVATLKDANGTILTGRAIVWTSDNPTIATVDETGLVTAYAPGVANITATSESKSATTAIRVDRAPVVSVSVELSARTLVVGATTTASTTLLDGAGKPAVQAIVVWSSSDLRIATVNADGVVTAVAPGQVNIVATSDGVDGSATLTVAAVGVPIISSIAPATLVPGATATITGAQFDAVGSRNTVSIRGASATILTSSPTQITVTVPCVNSGSASVIVTAAGIPTPVFAQPIATAARTLSVGESLVLTNNAGSLCNELVTTSETARYLIAVFSASTSQNTLVNFEIAGNTPTSVVAEPVIAPARMAAQFSIDSPELRELSAQDAVHWRMLERDRVQYEQSRARAAQLARSATPSRLRAALTAAPLPVPGELRDFFFTFNGGCQDVSTPMHTKAIYIGTRAIIWEDAANALQSSNDPAYLGFYQRLGQIFDQDQYATVRDNFGDPLLRDPLTDADGRVEMVFSSKLNGSGAAAYVTSCDQFARTVNAGSNFGEVFYGQVPTTTGSNVNSTNFPDGWFYFMGRTIVHEVKHIASQAARVANNAPTFEQSWLEEGTARHAEEMWVRNYLHHVAWKANTGFGSSTTNGVYCDFQPADATCNASDPLRRPSYGMRRQFNEIREKLLSPWDWSPYGDGTAQSGSVFYQTTWSLVRYAIDRYGTSDAAFFKALVNSSTNGVTNLTAVAGTSLDQLIGGWGLALFADDYPGLAPTNPELQFQTWNLRSIYGGLNASPNWNSRFPTAFPIAPVQLTFGAFVSSRSGLRGGAHSYYEVSGPALTNQLIELRGANGATPSTSLRIAIARLQ
ncbi:MAG: Ig-like domain-containing protein [Gemmatimonas sp.]